MTSGSRHSQTHHQRYRPLRQDIDSLLSEAVSGPVPHQAPVRPLLIALNAVASLPGDCDHLVSQLGKRTPAETDDQKDGGTP